MKIIFATRNEGKVKEINEMLSGMEIELVSLNQYPQVPEVIEDGKNYLENAYKKAKVISEFTGEITLADDSGLEVDVLDNEPGIYSARYAGEKATDDENNAKLLTKLKDVPQEKRTASFFCALVLYKKDGTHESFEARWHGFIIDDQRGANGFGYDPIFWVPDLKLTAAELSSVVKNRISHRGQAFAKLKSRLGEISN
jgi:XTP/dITP diphosphohydrolase